MASAVELAVGCWPDFLDDPARLPTRTPDGPITEREVHLPTPSATPFFERPAPVFRQPTATPTPDPDRERLLPR